MGADIHLFVEKKVDGKWVSADEWEREEEDGHVHVSVNYDKRLYHDRNYDLFAILADVRNGRGFAGCDTGDGFVPISDPRGLPEDVSPEVKECSAQWDGDGHSHSYFTVAELLAYDWTQTTKHRGWINGPVFARWNRWARKNGQGPESWCGGISGEEVTKVSLDELEARTNKIIADLRDTEPEEIDKALAKETSSVYAKAEWGVSYSSTCANFLSDTIPKLLRLGKQDEVRIVFFFDN